MASAEQPNLEEVGEGSLQPKKKSRFGSKLVRLILIIVVLAIIGAGATVFLLLQKKSELEAAEGENAPTTPQVNLAKPPSFVALEPFVVNLQPEDGERYLQVIMAVRVNDMKTGDSLKSFMPEIRHRINLRLTGKLPSEISTPPGQEQLAQEITADINSVLGSPLPGGPEALAHSVLFNSFIIQ